MSANETIACVECGGQTLKARPVCGLCESEKGLFQPPALLLSVPTQPQVKDEGPIFTFYGAEPMTPEEFLLGMANMLIRYAQQAKMVVRIETRALQPLRMGNYEMVASVQPKMEPR